MSLDLTLVTYEVRDGAAIVTINRPEQRNALNNVVLAELGAAVHAAKADPAVHSIVLTGAGDRAFCAGGDLKEMGGKVDPIGEHEGRGGLAKLFDALWTAGKPTIARVNGYCLAGGFGVALACDIVVASDKSQFGAPEIHVGLWPYMISVPLIRAMPPKQALKLMLTGERVDARRGYELGFVTDLVPESELDAKVDEYVATFRATSAQAMAFGRTTFYNVVDHNTPGRLAYLHTMLGLAITAPDADEGLAAFAEKRKPRWAAEPGE